jgi:uroporphyrinogen decarboxylase
VQYPEASHRLLDGITDILIDLLVAQYQAGADILQVFETNAEHLSPPRFREFALPYLVKLAREVKRRVPAVNGPPIIVYPKGGHHSLSQLAEESDFDAISIDWSIEPAKAVAIVREAARKTGKPVKALQGNLDPCELFGSPDEIYRVSEEMLKGFGEHPLIGNLGHGMLPAHKPEGLEAFFAAVHNISAARRAETALHR